MRVPVKFSYLPVAILLAAGISACADIRKFTYPENFVYLEDKEVDSLMQELTKDVVQLNRLLTDASETDADLQKKIVTELASIEKTALRLSGGHTQTNQIFVGEHIGEFTSQVGTAKMFASASPPRYYRARETISACQECHQFR